MDAEVLAERKAAKLGRLRDAAKALNPLIAKTAVDPNERVSLSEAEAQLRTAADLIDKLSAALAVYQDGDFYRDLPPSLATYDQGRHAANTLEYVFSE